MRIVSIAVVKDVQSTYLANAPVAVCYLYITDLAYPTVMVIPDGDVLHLDDRPEIVILNVWVVIVSRVETHTEVRCADAS